MSLDQLAIQGINAIVDEEPGIQIPLRNKYMSDPEELAYWSKYPILIDREKAALKNIKASETEM